MMLALAVLLFGAQSSPEPVLDAPPLDWLTPRAPYGMDITFDGKVWVNTNRTGARDDYAILANDFYRAITAGDNHPKVWIRGYHLRNPKAKYRETKQLVTFDCVRDTYWVERQLMYSPEGEVLATMGPFGTEPVVPGSVSEAWRDAICPEEK
jgi:hypothetical protein